jgi:hypothetical protein
MYVRSQLDFIYNYLRLKVEAKAYRIPIMDGRFVITQTLQWMLALFSVSVCIGLGELGMHARTLGLD